MKSAQIRSQFLNFFEAREHRVVASGALVPANDPTLLFTNAGMVQFKDVFLGAEQRDYRRAVSAQRCVRAGGKHNDLDQVGYTARHHTFFEMLGNFSFGDYFKREAIVYAWEFLTEVCGLAPDRLWVTVYHDDDEAHDIWTEGVGVPTERVIRIGDKAAGKAYDSDNFWAMGETGPCGPCTEIFYDHGPAVAGGPPGSPEEDGDRYIEVWNLVFMQFDRDDQGRMQPLPAPCVDTGMGLERLAAILQGVHSNYDIDLFQRLIEAAAKLTGCADQAHDSLKVIADHIRACAFLIADGVLPSNEGRGYVLRRIIRRALRHGHKLGRQQPFFHAMVAPLTAEMGQAYPELKDKADWIASVLKTEEQRFAITLDQGMRLLEQSIAALNGDTIPGDTVFRLYDTYGFPADLTADIARERGLEVDMPGFDAAMGEQKARAQAAGQFSGGVHLDASLVQRLPATEFLGYQEHQASAKVLAILVDGKAQASLRAGEKATIILNQTPFYAESGGQVGDHGTLSNAEATFKVHDTQKLAGQYHGHIGQLEQGQLNDGQIVSAGIDLDYRKAIMLNHSATHLLHAALRHVLGQHVEQKGSLVAADRLRFDFSHVQPVSGDELERIEQLVNEQIRANAAAEVAVMAYDQAIEAGAMALFGEKYGDEVRVMRFGPFSVELCGGTHVERVGDIGLFKIVSESGIASGVRRIEAVTGASALQWINRRQHTLQQVSELVKADSDEVAAERVRQLMERSRALEKELERLKGKLASASGDELADQAQTIDGIKVVAAKLDGINPKQLRDTVDRLKDKLGSAAVVLATVNGGKVQLAAGVSKDQTSRIKAGDLVNAVAQQVGGRGGGRADMAQAGGTEPDKLGTALASVPEWVRKRLS